jgi:hypothetical protein
MQWFAVDSHKHSTWALVHDEPRMLFLQSWPGHEPE